MSAVEGKGWGGSWVGDIFELKNEFKRIEWVA